jgi:hypothetical protein
MVRRHTETAHSAWKTPNRARFGVALRLPIGSITIDRRSFLPQPGAWPIVRSNPKPPSRRAMRFNLRGFALFASMLVLGGCADDSFSPITGPIATGGPELSFRGTVRSSLTGEPIPGARIRLYAPGEPFDFPNTAASATTARSGDSPPVRSGSSPTRRSRESCARRRRRNSTSTSLRSSTDPPSLREGGPGTSFRPQSPGERAARPLPTGEARPRPEDDRP